MCFQFEKILSALRYNDIEIHWKAISTSIISLTVDIKVNFKGCNIWVWVLEWRNRTSVCLISCDCSWFHCQCACLTIGTGVVWSWCRHKVVSCSKTSPFNWHFLSDSCYLARYDCFCVHEDFFAKCLRRWKCKQTFFEGYVSQSQS